MELCMPPLTFWKGVGTKTKDYQFFDRMVNQYINIGGSEFYIHKYIGPTTTQSKAPSDSFGSSESILDIEDLVNLEIRDRKYDPDVYSLKGHYMVSDTEFDLKQFGLFLSSDTVFITFHLNKMVEMLGRRLISGDVIEVLHMRDDTASDGIVTNKFYVVEDGIRSAEGFSSTWWPHLWRIKCQPLTNSQEFSDILNQALIDRGDGISPPPLNADGSAPTLGQLTSTYDKEIAINDAILEEATASVAFRNFQSAHFYIMQSDSDIKPDVFNSDGIPPNGSKPVPSGTFFPDIKNDQDYFLRIDYIPPVLYKWENSMWKRIETNWRSEWLPANAALTTFINNTKKTKLNDGSIIDEKANLRTAVKPKIDPDII
jgi:hypothetical protein